MDNLLETILQTCFTKQQALKKLEELKEQQDKENYTSEGVARDGVPRRVPAVNLRARTSGGAVERQDPINMIKKMESLVIFTAIPLPEDQIPILGNFVRKTFPQMKLIDLKVDPNLIGGASFSWKGNLRDYSLRSKFSWK